jgi:hypothetical protein
VMIGFRFPAFGQESSSWAFLVRWVSQLCAFLKESRQGSSILRCLFNHVEVISLSCKCLVPFFFSFGIIRFLDFLIFFGYYFEYFFSW